ncbi:MAG TPA: trypsin-like peptidase domain-containing protein [Rhodanobacteraceae bacterium]|nr:trypsin-like peptidase domain-containing protein [Rhodanobacteraceae bacterium]
MLRKFWLLFAQACTLVIAALFVVSTLRPDLVPRLAREPAAPVVNVVQGAPSAAAAPVASYADAAKKAMPAVVNIYTSREIGARNPLADDEIFRRYFPDLAKRMAPQRARSLGSGVIVAPEGYVLTNFHVVDGADDITLVLADGREIKAKVRGSDPESDLAVLKAATDGLPAITLGDLDSVRVGDVVLAIGNPFGFGNTVTAGIVSALGRNHLGINRFEDFIQTDAPINPGNSGGALVDTSGNLIGINSTIYSQSGGSLGIGFAIPVSLARSVLSQIIEKGEVTRGWLGIEPADLSEDGARALALDRADGVLIRSLQPDGPADRAGLKVRDVVVDVAGKPTHDVAGLMARIAELAPGTTAKVKVWRAPQTVDLDVVVGKRPQAQAQPQ